MSADGKTTNISPAVIFRLLQRRKWFLAVPIILITPALAYYASTLPRKFRARALVGTLSVLPDQTARPGMAELSEFSVRLHDSARP